jgi:phosphoglycerol transferase MdoB-like AlkP superfamily enzyme
MALVCAASVWFLDPALTGHLNGALIWRNALPLFLLFVFCYGLSGRVLCTVWLMTGATWLLFKVNAVKEFNMDVPLMPDDVLLTHQVSHNIGFFSHYVGYKSVLLAAAVLVFLLVFIAIARVEQKRPKPSWKLRAAYALMAFTTFATLISGAGFWATVYGDAALPSYNKWAPILMVQQNGLVASLVRRLQIPRMSIPAADKQMVLRFDAEHRDELAARASRTVTGEQPDIVVVQSEAFFDPGVLRNVDFGQYVPNFERLAASGITGALTTPTYGGGTIRTEFETLTGYPMRAFPDIAYPYFGLASPWMPTIPHRLEALGYATALYHPFRADFWDRDAVMPGLGFQESRYQDDFKDAPHAGSFISDRALFDQVLQRLARQNDQPLYLMAITMENHGPWNRSDALQDQLNGIPLPQGLSSAGQEELRYYLSHVIYGDKALGEFTTKLLGRHRWTILLFYGDHLPSLNAVYSDLGFDDDRPAPEEHTRYMVLSNRPFDPQQRRHLDLHAYDLPALLFDIAKLPESGNLAFSSVILQMDRTPGKITPEAREALSFNGAIMEVRCRRPLEPTGRCPH